MAEPWKPVFGPRALNDPLVVLMQDEEIFHSSTNRTTNSLQTDSQTNRTKDDLTSRERDWQTAAVHEVKTQRLTPPSHFAAEDMPGRTPHKHSKTY